MWKIFLFVSPGWKIKLFCCVLSSLYLHVNLVTLGSKSSFFILGFCVCRTRQYDTICWGLDLVGERGGWGGGADVGSWFIVVDLCWGLGGAMRSEYHIFSIFCSLFVLFLIVLSWLTHDDCCVCFFFDFVSLVPFISHY